MDVQNFFSIGITCLHEARLYLIVNVNFVAIVTVNPNVFKSCNLSSAK